MRGHNGFVVCSVFVRLCLYSIGTQFVLAILLSKIMIEILEKIPLIARAIHVSCKQRERNYVVFVTLRTCVRRGALGVHRGTPASADGTDPETMLEKNRKKFPGF